MKKLLFLAIFTMLCQITFAQDLAINLRFSGATQFKLSSKARIELRQQLQINPEIRNLKSKKDLDIFNEIELFPYSRDRNRQDSDDDDDDDENNVNGGFNELNDSRQRIKMEWRSATTLDFDYKLRKWLTLGQSYSLLLDEKRRRHLFRSDVTFQPRLGIKKLNIPQRFAFQLATRERRGVAVLDHDFSIRSGIEWAFKKRHELYANATVNGAFEQGEWGWDRLRCDAGLQYTFNKIHQFDFGYRFQQRLNQKRRTSHGVSLQYSVRF